MDPIWTRLPNETAKAYMAFEVYRDMGHDRSIRKTGKILAKNHKSLAKLSRKNNWVKRANAFDAYVGKRKAEAMANDSVKKHRRNAEVAKLFQKIALAPLIVLQWRLNNTDWLLYKSDYNQVGTSELMELAPNYFKMYWEGVDKESAARGFEEKGAEDMSTPIDVKSLLNNPEFIRFVETFIQNRPEQMTSLHQDAQSEDTRVEEGEGSVESKECPTPSTVLRRRPRTVNGDSSVVKNQCVDPRCSKE
jgi:hypothetical protein